VESSGFACRESSGPPVGMTEKTEGVRPFAWRIFSIHFEVVPDHYFSVIGLLDFAEQLLVGDAVVGSASGGVIDDHNSRLRVVGNLRQFACGGMILRT